VRFKQANCKVTFLTLAYEILQEPVDEKFGKSGGVLGFFHSVNELDALKDLGQKGRTVE